MRVPGPRLAALLAAGLFGLVAVGFAGAPASAAAAPAVPGVRGLSPAEAEQAVDQAFRPARGGPATPVTVTFSPALAELPPGTELSTVVASRAGWVNPDQFGTATPQVVITLGSAVPDLTGQTLVAATAVLRRHGLSIAAEPNGVAAGWLVTGQELQPGLVVEFRAPLTVYFAAPGPVGPAAPAGASPTRIAVLAGSALAVLVLLAALVALVRRRRSAKRLRRRVTAQAHPGQVIGPELIELLDPFQLAEDPR